MLPASHNGRFDTQNREVRTNALVLSGCSAGGQRVSDVASATRLHERTAQITGHWTQPLAIFAGTLTMSFSI